MKGEEGRKEGERKEEVNVDLLVGHRSHVESHEV